MIAGSPHLLLEQGKTKCQTEDGDENECKMESSVAGVLHSVRVGVGRRIIRGSNGRIRNYTRSFHRYHLYRDDPIFL